MKINSTVCDLNTQVISNNSEIKHEIECKQMSR